MRQSSSTGGAACCSLEATARGYSALVPRGTGTPSPLRHGRPGGTAAGMPTHACMHEPSCSDMSTFRHQHCAVKDLYGKMSCG